MDKLLNLVQDTELVFGLEDAKFTSDEVKASATLPSARMLRNAERCAVPGMAGIARVDTLPCVDTAISQ